MNRFVKNSNQRYSSIRKPKKSGKRFYVTVLILMILVAAGTTALCVWFASTGTSGEGPAHQPDSGSSQLSGSSSQPETSSDSVSSDVSSNTSSDAPANSSSGTVPMPDEEYLLILAAEQAFGKNSLDQKHTAAMNEADTMNKMLSVYDDTLEAWRKQLNTLVAKLSTYTTTDQKALQSQWEQTAADLIRKREEALTSQGGTIQQLEVAEYACMLYRQRGLALFTELYRYDDTYIF